MHARLLASLAPLALAAVGSAAHAQAADEPTEPEAGDPEAEVTGPSMVAHVAVAPVAVAPVTAPVMVGPAPCDVIHVARRESVMNNRWSVGLSLGSMSLTPDHSDTKTAFAIGELALRYRLTPHLELQASAGGGREQLDNGDEGDLEVNTAALALRFRFNPEGAWNWFALGGLGAASVTSHDATQDQRDTATHPMVMLGIGVERRFHHFALEAELRGVAISDKSKDDRMPVEMATAGGPTTSAAAVRQSGGSLTIGASYYF